MRNMRDLATVLAALQFWREEMCPYGRSVAQPYLQTVGCGGIDPLTESEITDLMERLQEHRPSDPVDPLA